MDILKKRVWISAKATLSLEIEDCDSSGYQRPDRLCYSGKVELLGQKHPCKDGFCIAFENKNNWRLNMNNIKLGRYRHFKGNEYEAIGIAKHSETMEPMVVYRALYGDRDLWVRPASMWNEIIERDGKSFQRFTLIEEKTDDV